MTEDLEALVSHLHVVGGRAVSAPPPGALVQLAPKRSPRIRERDALFVLVLPAQGTHAQAVFYEEMARTAAQRYFEQEGPILAGLEATLASLNADLFKHNQANPRQPFYAEMACLVLRGQEVNVAYTAGVWIGAWQDGLFQSFPAQLAAPDLTSERPLGLLDTLEPRVQRFAVAAGHLVAISDPALAALPQEALRSAGMRGNVQAMVGRLKTHELPAATALVMQFVPPEAPEPASAAQPGTDVPAEAAAPATQTQPGATAPQPGAAGTSVLETSAPDPVPQAESSAGGRLGGLFGRGERGKRPPAVRPLSEAKSAPSGGPRLGERLQGLREKASVGGEALAGAASAARPALDTLQTEGRSVYYRAAQRILRLLRAGLLRLSAGLAWVQRLLNRLLPEPEPGRPPSLPTPIAAGAAILIPMAVVLLVVAYALTSQDESAFERCLSQAQIAQGVARGIRDNESGDAQQAWYGVMEVVNQCLPRRPDDPVLAAIRDEAQREIDRFAEVLRCPMTPLRRYQTGASVRGPVLRNDVDLYTLDVTHGVLYHDVLNDAGNALSRQGEVLVQRGAAVGEFIIRDLVDIAWVAEGGGARGSRLLALDARGVLVTYSPTFPPANAQALVGADRWVRPAAIETWQGRLYILDPPANQIWRYQPVAGEFPSAPEEYFVGDNRPDLRHAVDLAIDDNGYLYVLKDDGSLLKFYTAEEQIFQFSHLPGGGVGALGSASALYLDQGLISPGFYVIDGANQTIHETTAGGTFIHSYRAPAGASLRDVSGLAVDSAAEYLYVAARDVLYVVPRCG